MAYSQEGIERAERMVMSATLSVLDLESPGTRRAVYDLAAMTLSQRLEREDNETDRVALMLIGEWSEAHEASAQSATRTDEYKGISATIQEAEGLALSCSMRLSCLMDQLEAIKPGIGNAADRAAIKQLEKLHANMPELPEIRFALDRVRALLEATPKG